MNRKELEWAAEDLRAAFRRQKRLNEMDDATDQRALAKVNRARRISEAKKRRRGPLGRFVVWLLGDFERRP